MRIEAALMLLILATPFVIAAESNLIGNDDEWFSSVCGTEEIMKDGDDQIDWIWDGDASQVAIELRYEVLDALNASEMYKISPEFETIKDDYEAALILYIMNLDDLLDAIETMNMNGYVEGSRAMEKMETAFHYMEYHREEVLDVCDEQPYNSSQDQGSFGLIAFPPFETIEDVMKFFCLNNQSIYRTSPSGTSQVREMNGTDLAKEILDNPDSISILNIANEYGLTRWGSC